MLENFEKILSEFEKNKTPDMKEIVSRLVDNTPEGLFPGIQALKENHPATYQNMKQEIYNVLTSEKGKEKNEKINEIRSKFNLAGESERALTGFIEEAEEIKQTLQEKEVTAERIQYAREKLKTLEKQGGVLMEKIFSIGGIFTFIFLITCMIAFMIAYEGINFLLQRKGKKQ